MKALQQGNRYRVYAFALLIAALAFAIPGTVFGGGACGGECTFYDPYAPWDPEREGECLVDEVEGCGCVWNGWWQEQSACDNPV